MRAIELPQICETVDYIFNRPVRFKETDWRSTLTLLVARIRTDHTHDAVAPNNFALAADAFNRCQHFHG